MTEFNKLRFSVAAPNTDKYKEEHDRIFTPPPGSHAARRRGCKCEPGAAVSTGCILHPLNGEVPNAE